MGYGEGEGFVKRDLHWSGAAKAWVPRIKSEKRAKTGAERMRAFHARKRYGVLLVQIELWPDQIKELVAREYLTADEAKDARSVREAFDDFATIELRKHA